MTSEKQVLLDINLGRGYKAFFRQIKMHHEIDRLQFERLQDKYQSFQESVSQEIQSKDRLNVERYEVKPKSSTFCDIQDCVTTLNV